ncbi:MAG: acetyl-CoA carboxylase biotin carboxyl carrier protein [Alphaproteobacteria bacterium]|nr:acetyl-CoA carboxylase biotin carboxyl carrier protein [Alphaproteobacteria bacterium]
MAAVTVDADLIRRLAALLEETGLGEIEYEAGGHRVRVARRAMAPMATTLAPTLDAGATTVERNHPGAVTAPMVGTVYLGPEPGAPPFLQVGDKVLKGQTLLIIEAMKVMNQIQAPRAGTLRRVLVENGAPVEYGEALAIVE